MAANWWYRRGGLGAVMVDEAEALERRGHAVIPFAAAHPANLPTPYARSFPRFRETQDAGAGMGGLDRIRTAVSLVYNRDAAARFSDLLDEVRPEIVHLHNAARQLSPSVVLAARRRRIPVLITAHDYSLVCPQGQLYRGDREPCGPPNCLRGDVWHVVGSRCVKGSTAASAVAAVEHLVHRSLGMYTGCDLIIAPSGFLARTLVRAGLPARKIAVLPNGIEPASPPAASAAAGGHVLYGGRLAREKGLGVLMAAAGLVPGIPFVIAGDGPEAEALRSGAPPNVTFVGHQDPAALAALLAGAVAVVMPSTWFENAPISLLEALRAARPVVATDIGGHPEMLSGGGGVLIPPGDAPALANAISSLWGDREGAARMGAAGREAFEARYTLAGHVDRLEDIYRRLAAGGASPQSWDPPPVTPGTVE